MAKLTTYEKAFREIMRMDDTFDGITVGDPIRIDREQFGYDDESKQNEALHELLETVKYEIDVLPYQDFLRVRYADEGMDTEDAEKKEEKEFNKAVKRMKKFVEKYEG